MRMMGLVLVAIVVLVAAAVAVVYARGRPREAAPPLAAGPFTILTNERRISTGGFPNTSGNPFATRPTIDYAVHFQGKPIAVPDANGEAFDAFWDARVLGGAPKPAVLAGSLGVWLFTEGDDGQVVVTTLAEATSDFATLQWLDADGGQPGEEFVFAMHDAPTAPRTLTEGRRLLVNRRVVLDVATLAVQRFEPTAYNPALDAFSPSGERARMTSPDGRQVVFAASRNADADYDYALVAVDIATGGGYAVPFPRTPTRFHSVWDIDRAWLDHYFEWRPDEAGWRLHYRDDVAPRPWRGRVTRYDGGMVEYRIEPVAPEMRTLLVAFIERTESATSAPGDGDRRAVLRVGDEVFNVSYDADQQSVVLYAEIATRRDEGAARIERIAAAFDAELATRRHDALFGSLDGAE
jgi:hypothetical protein